jgi:hypothetical protein
MSRFISFVTGVISGIYITQHYSIPDVTSSIKLLLKQIAYYEKNNNNNNNNN